MNKNNISYRMHNIAINDENYQTLKGLGTVGDSFNDVATRLIRIAKRRAEEKFCPIIFASKNTKK